MKKIITTVGTSLITNESNKIDRGNLNKLKNKPYSEWDNKIRRINQLKNELENLITDNENKNNTNLSAEIASIIKIAEQEPNENFEVYLLATDTILSPLCAEYVKKWFEENEKNISVFFDKKNIIQRLQVKNKLDFEKKGLKNLFTKIQNIANGYWNNVILNITGGYKAIIPYMSIVAQIYELPAYYIFQESKDQKFELLKIPNIPITVNEQLFEKYWFEIENIAETGKRPDNYNLEQELSSILEIERDNAMLTSLGYVLWEKYKERFFLFYCPDDIWREIEKQNDIKRILQTKFWNKEARENKTEQKQEHYVFDDGNNNNRIYYFAIDDKIYIYKTFENEEKAKEFINSKIDKDEMITNSKVRKIEIKK